MNNAECQHFSRSDSASPEKPMRLHVTAELDDKNLPVFGEKREFEARNADDMATLTIYGICNATHEKIAVERFRYENVCMQPEHAECSRFKAGKTGE